MNFQFGVDYYPEHWPEERWEFDARLMKEMGLKVVRLAEFAWVKMEPRLGQFEWDWLERVLTILEAHGLEVVLGTPTACPPAWMIEADPLILPVDSQGRTRGFGGRHHTCHSLAVYRSHVERIVLAMGERFGKDPRVAGWQIDNELGNSQEDLCHCDSCRTAFQVWLAGRYGSIDQLNQSWGTVFWSQTYDRFDQVPTPRLTPNSHSPSLLLDWKRFRSALLVEFLEFQVRLLKQVTKNQFVTHNLMGLADSVDYFDLGKSLDFVSHDQYPHGFWERQKSPSELASTLDLMAGVQQRPFWIMEQQSGPTGWELVAPTPRPGQLALWAIQSVARGADTVVFFRWRACTVGTEQYWHGILPHNGIPGRRFEELRDFISQMSPVMPLFEGALAEPRVGILYSYEQNWALEIQPHHPDLDYVSFVQKCYQAFWKENVPVAFLSQDADLSGFRLVVAPLLFLELPGIRDKLYAYVRQGGQLVLSMRTGVKTDSNICQTEASLPGPYGEMLGIKILDYDCLRDGPHAVIQGERTYLGHYWWDQITLAGAAVWAQGGEGFHRGEPIVTFHPFGAGQAWYVGTDPAPELWSDLVEDWVMRVNLDSLGPRTEGVEIVRRRTPNRDFLFVLNHTSLSKPSPMLSGWEQLVGGAELGPYGYQVYCQQRH